MVTPDKHTLGVGARAYFDYVLNEMIYINLYGEFIYYPMTVKLDTTNYFNWAAVFLVIALVAALLGFGGIAGSAVGIAKILFFVFLVLFVLSLIFGGLRRGPSI